MPWLWLVGGVNGAGKSTFAQSVQFRELVGDVVLLNPDIIATELSRKTFRQLSDEDNLAAARATEERLAAALARRADVAVETVLSTAKYRPYAELAKRLGFDVGLIYLALTSPAIAIERIRLRVSAGGHNVPADRVAARWRRSLTQALEFCPAIDRIIVLGNDDATPTLIAHAYGADWNEAKMPLASTLRPWLARLAAEWRRTHPA